MATYKVRDPQGNVREIQGPDGATDEQILSAAKSLFAAAPKEKDYRALQNVEQVDPAADMGQLERFNAGAGGAMTNAWEGAKQLVGAGPSAEEVRNRRELDKPLMNTGAGMAGNIGGNIAMLAPLAVAPGAATVGGSAALGAVAGGAQPAESIKERIIAMLTGGALSGGAQAAAGPVAQTVGRWGTDRAAAKAAEQSQNAVRDATLKAGQEAGLTAPKSIVQPSVLNSVLESVGGKAASLQKMSLNNQKVVNELARAEANLPPTQALSESALKAARKAAAGPYRELTAISPKAAADMDALKQARLDSKLNWQEHSRQGTVEAYKKAVQADKIAAALENALEAEAAQVGRADLLPALREARQQIAKIHDVERAVNVGTGDVEAAVLGRMRDRGAPLSGGLKTIADFQQAFPSVMREAPKVPSPETSHLNAVASALLGGGGMMAAGPAGLTAAAIPFVARPAARSLVMNAGRTVKPDYALSAAEKIAMALADKERLALAARGIALPMIPAMTGAD